MFSIQITFDSITDLRGKIQALVGTLPVLEVDFPKRGPGRPKAVPIEPPSTGLPDPPPPPAPKPVALVDPFALEDLAGAPAAVKETTFDDVTTALKQLAEKRPGDKSEAEGLKRVTDMLARFGCSEKRPKVKDLKPENYADVVQRCQQWLAT